jgi:hypothetical protein
MKTKPMNTSVIRAPVALLISAGLLLLVAGTQGSDPGARPRARHAGRGKTRRSMECDSEHLQ